MDALDKQVYVEENIIKDDTRHSKRIVQTKTASLY